MPDYYNIYGPVGTWDRSHGLTSDDVLGGYLGDLDILGGSESALNIPGKPVQSKAGKFIPFGDGLGWNRARGNALDLFVQLRKRQPNPAEKAVLHRLAKFIGDAQRRGGGDDTAEHDVELGWLLLTYFLRHGEEAKGADLAAIKAQADSVIRDHVLAYYANKPKGWLSDFVQDIGSAVHTVTHAASSVYGAATDALEKVPVIGQPIHAVLDLSGGSALKLADSIANGDNVSRAALGTFKDSLTNAQTVSQYASMITSAVPGLGQVGAGISGAIAAAHAISQGMPVTEALIDSVKDAALKAIPGGAIAQKAASEAFEIGKAVANGERIDQIALERTRAQLPPAMQKVFDVGLAVAQGQKMQDVLVKGVAALAPNFDLVSDGSKVLAASPVLRRAALALSGPEREGFKMASGLLARKGIPPMAVAALRAKIDPALRRGFDKAVNAHAVQFKAFRQV